MRGMVVLAVGCAKQPVVNDWGDPDGSALLVDAPEQVYSERIELEHRPRARLLPDGPDLLQERREPWPLPLVVADPTPWPRVILDTYDLQVLVYVERDALQSRVAALAEGTGPGGDGLVRLLPGTIVEELEEDGARVRVQATVEALTREAGLPRQAIDEVWAEDVPLPELQPSGAQKTLLGGAEILDRPGGSVLATVIDLGRLPTQPVWVDEGSWSRGHLLVTVSTPQVQLQGWVHEDDLADEFVIYQDHIGCGGMADSSSRLSWSRTFETFVPAGTLLSTHPGGPVVARTLMDVPVPDSAREEGHVLQRSTRLGEIELWIAPGDVW
jgi:hypothetical protein